MYCYIFDKGRNDWLETEELFPHDIALLIDSGEKKVYFYSGPKAKPGVRQQAEAVAQTIIDKFKMYEFESLRDVIPLKVQGEIELLMGENYQLLKDREPRTPLMISQMIVELLLTIGSIILLIIAFLPLQWEKTGLDRIVDPAVFAAHFALQDLFLLISIIIGGLAFINACINKRLFLIISTAIPVLIGIGSMIYNSPQDVLFHFSEANPYVISRWDLAWHLFWMVIVAVGIGGPSVFNIIIILQQTIPVKKIPVDHEELRKKSRPTILQDKEPVKMEEVPPPE